MKNTFIAVFFLVIFSIFGQQKHYKNLVFEGAGIRGIAYAGVVRILEETHLLDSIENVGGTSAGAIVAGMIAVGYNSKEIENIIGSTKFRKFNHGGCGICRLKKHFGWYRSDRFRDFLAKLIADKTGNADITFKELTENKAYKSLYVTGTSINQQKTIVFSAENYPDMKIVDAIRISMSIPLYFEAIFIDKKGNVFKKFQPDKQLDVMVDGGILANFPIFIFDKYQNKNGQKIRVENMETLGIRIDSDEQIKQDAVDQQLISYEVKDFKGFTEAFYILVLENLNRNKLTQADWARSVSVSSKKIGPRIKKLSEAQKQLLIESGREGMMRFLKRYE